jgi:hypothetical protein
MSAHIFLSYIGWLVSINVSTVNGSGVLHNVTDLNKLNDSVFCSKLIHFTYIVLLIEEWTWYFHMRVHTQVQEIPIFPCIVVL